MAEKYGPEGDKALEAGDSFGELAILDPSHMRTRTVITELPSELAVRPFSPSVFPRRRVPRHVLASPTSLSTGVLNTAIDRATGLCSE